MSVITRSTHPIAVSGSEQRSTSLLDPSGPRWFITAITRRAPTARSIAPPIPATFFPGTIQLARSPFSATSIAPSTAASTCPPRIIANESAESKVDPPGRIVTVCLPALITRASTSSSYGNGPIPRSPFSEWRTIPSAGSR